MVSAKYNISAKSINELLVAEDIEHFIEFGAPSDEYENEAAQVAAALALLAPEEITAEVVLAAMLKVWANSFELSAEEVQLRVPAMKHVIAAMAN